RYFPVGVFAQNAQSETEDPTLSLFLDCNLLSWCVREVQSDSRSVTRSPGNALPPQRPIRYSPPEHRPIAHVQYLRCRTPRQQRVTFPGALAGGSRSDSCAVTWCCSSPGPPFTWRRTFRASASWSIRTSSCGTRSTPWLRSTSSTSP